MLTIYKYPIELTDFFQIEMPEGAKVLFFATQGNIPCIWASVNTNNKIKIRKFRLAGTGHQLSGNEHYIGSTIHGPYVWHLFEVDL